MSNLDKMYDSYDDSAIYISQSDIEKIRLRIEPYIGYRGSKGFRHLIKEIMQNSIDEYSCKSSSDESKNSPCSFVKIEYDDNTQAVKIIDDGRGIPPKSIVDIFTTLQAGGKFGKGNDKAYKFAAGENGVGTTVTNALSEYVTITVCRKGIKTIVYFIDGEHTETKELKCDKDLHGTIVEFKPSARYLGKDIENFEYEEILGLAEYMSYLAKGCPLLIEIKTKEGKKIKKKILSENGIIDKLIPIKNKLIEPIFISYSEGNKKFEVALTYTSDGQEDIVSYANYCTTIDHGTHVIGFRQGLSNAITKYVKNNLTDTEKKKYSVIADDCKIGLHAVVNAFHEEASFVGQVKEKINNDDLIAFCRNSTFLGLNKWLKDNDIPAKKLLKHVKSVMKARINSEELRKNKIAKPKSSFDLPDKFKPATGKKNLEIIVVEGDSAGGSANMARIREFQALYYLKGVPKNPYGLSLLKIMANEEYNGFLTIAGVTGSKFDIDKFPYERLIILTDADTDGKRITSLFSIFVALNMPEVVERGMLYKAIPPLYKITKGKNNKKYLIDNSEYNTFIRKLIGSSISLFDINDNNVKIEDFLDKNRYYLDELKIASNRTSIHPYILENIIDCRLDEKKIKKFIDKECKFLKYNTSSNTITGIFDKEYQHIKLDDKLFSKLNGLIDLCEENKSIIYKFEDELGRRKLTVAQILDEIKKHEPKGRMRYKGLGEMDPEELWETTLDPRERTLIRLTTDDLKKDIERFALLHSDDLKMRKERKDMMSKFKLAYDEIDN